MFVKPKPGVNVYDPRTLKPIPESGRLVPDNNYWFRRLADGDVMLVESDSKIAPEPKQ